MSVPFEGIGPVQPGRLVLAAQAPMKGELETVRVSADTADRHGHLFSADQRNSAGTDPGITASERIQAGRRGRWRGSGGGCGIDSKKLMPAQ